MLRGGGGTCTYPRHLLPQPIPPTLVGQVCDGPHFLRVITFWEGRGKGGLLLWFSCQGYFRLEGGGGAGAQPATAACKNGSSVGMRTRCAHVFFFARFGAGSHARSVAHWQKFLRRSSGGSLLRVRCWLGGGGGGEEDTLPLGSRAQSMDGPAKKKKFCV